MSNSKNHDGSEPRILCSKKFPFRIEEETKTFEDKHKVKEFTTINLAQHKILKGIPYKEEVDKK